jgi:hypothetical protein
VLDEDARKLKKGKENQKMLEAAQCAKKEKKKKVIGRKERKKKKKIKIGPLLAHSPISCLW